MSKWEVLVFLLCWELVWGCWFQSIFATPMQNLHEHQSWCLFWHMCVCVFYFSIQCSCKNNLCAHVHLSINIWTHYDIIVIIKRKRNFTFSSYNFYISHVIMKIKITILTIDYDQQVDQSNPEPIQQSKLSMELKCHSPNFINKATYPTSQAHAKKPCHDGFF